MLRIWGRTNSINVQKVMWTVGELELAHERTDAGLAYGVVGDDWYADLNPNRLVPSINDNGLQLWESNVIVRYLAAKHATGTLMPETLIDRALAEQWMDWQQTAILPAMTPVFWRLIRTPSDKRDQAAIDQGAKTVRAALTILDRHLGDKQFILGDELTVADIPLGCVAYRWFALPVEHGDIPNVRAWYESLATRPAFQAHVMLPVT